MKASTGFMAGLLLAGLLAGCGTSGPQDGAGGQRADLPPVPAPPPAAAPLEQRLDDAIAQGIGGDEAEIRVTNVGGTVLLTGQVLSEEAKARASNAAAFSGGGELRRMVNELRVVDVIDNAAAEADARLDASVEMLLDDSDPALGEKVEAVAENGTVYLLGQVSREEGNEAAGLVSRLQGVASIRTVFDYTD